LALAEAGVRQRTERLLNDHRVPENQEIERILESRIRPKGLKIGHKETNAAIFPKIMKPRENPGSPVAGT